MHNLSGIIPQPMDLGNVWFDYKNQAWVKDGKYQRCGHITPCDCYGKAHEGEIADKRNRVDGDAQ